MPKSNKSKRKKQVDVTAVSVRVAARLLDLPESLIREHRKRGLPADTKGQINLVKYAAWLNTSEAQQ